MVELTGPVRIKRFRNAGSAPAALLPGEIAINERDGIFFYADGLSAVDGAGRFTGVLQVPLKAVVAALSTVRGLALGGTGVAAASPADLLAKLGAQPALGFVPESTANKGQANGYAGLGSDGKLLSALLPASVVGDLQYQSAWNATTNTPAIPAAAPANKGQYYVVQTAGSTAIGGVSDWQVGDWLVSDGTAWDKIDNTDAVKSVAGLVGAITAGTLKTALAIVAADISGLGNAATRNVGTTSGTVAAGDALAAGLATVAQASDLNIAQQNLLYQGLLIAALRGVPTGIVDGIIDPFSSTADVNTSASNGYTFDNVNGLIRSVSSPVAVSIASQAISGGDYGGQPASLAFNGSTSDSWTSSQTGSGVSGISAIGQDYGAGHSQSFGKFDLTTTSAGASGQPTSVLVQYADTSSGPWTTYSTVSLSSIAAASTKYTFSVGAVITKRCWRLLANSNPTGNDWEVAELVFYNNGAASAMTLQSSTLPINAGIVSPSAMRALIQVDSTSATFTPNTDLIASLSRDGGTTFTQGTLSLVQTMPDGTAIYDTGWLSVAGQPAGNSTMTYKITTPTAKAVVLTGVSMQVKP